MNSNNNRALEGGNFEEQKIEYENFNTGEDEKENKKKKGKKNKNDKKNKDCIIF